MAGSRTPLIAGNWKMHLGLAESRTLAREVFTGAKSALAEGRFRLGIFPTALAVAAVVEEARGLSAGDSLLGDALLIGAQNIHPEPQGAFTGEISAPLVAAAGANAVLVGHSERRHVFGEDDALVGSKVVAALANGLRPVLCVGELLEERDAGRTEEVVSTQLRAGLQELGDVQDLDRVIIAYEPVWAIGTGRTASPEQAQEVHGILRPLLGQIYESLGAPAGRCEESHILYGGSVKPQNARELLQQSDVDGALVGGASLTADAFLGICEAC